MREFAQERMAAYRVSPQEAQGIAHWLRSACLKITAARQAGDDLKVAYLIATNSFEIFVALWAINQRPLPAGGGILAHLKDLPQQPEPNPGWPKALFRRIEQKRLQIFLALCDWAIPLLETQRLRPP